MMEASYIIFYRLYCINCFLFRDIWQRLRDQELFSGWVIIICTYYNIVILKCELEIDIKNTITMYTRFYLSRRNLINYFNFFQIGI